MTCLEQVVRREANVNEEQFFFNVFYAGLTHGFQQSLTIAHKKTQM